MDKPTHEELFDGLGFEEVESKVIDTWRHGNRYRVVWKRESDSTYWGTSFRVSTDGETNDLRDGLAQIYQVVPVEKTIVVREWSPIAT
jgi:hypothetical protein